MLKELDEEDNMGCQLSPERISREQYNVEIIEALERVMAGHYVTQEDVENDAATW